MSELCSVKSLRSSSSSDSSGLAVVLLACVFIIGRFSPKANGLDGPTLTDCLGSASGKFTCNGILLLDVELPLAELRSSPVLG